MARKHCTRAIQRLAELMNSEDERVSLGACIAMLDRGHGKPAQTVEHAGADGGPLQVHIVKYSDAA